MDLSCPWLELGQGWHHCSSSLHSLRCFHVLLRPVGCTRAAAGFAPGRGREEQLGTAGDSVPVGAVLLEWEVLHNEVTPTAPVSPRPHHPDNGAEERGSRKSHFSAHGVSLSAAEGWPESHQHCFNFPGGCSRCAMAPAGNFSCLVLLCFLQWDVTCQNMTRQPKCVTTLHSNSALQGGSAADNIRLQLSLHAELGFSSLVEYDIWEPPACIGQLDHTRFINRTRGVVLTRLTPKPGIPACSCRKEIFPPWLFQLLFLQ